MHLDTEAIILNELLCAYCWAQAETQANKQRSEALTQAEQRVQERERWLAIEQQELDKTRERVSVAPILEDM